jgi:uncharacterized membrane protein YdjX (TVP38/TMEM64 family)
MNSLSEFVLRIEELGGWGPAIFIIVYVVATVALFPGSLLTLAAGAIFGLWRGVAIDFTAAVLGACAAFAVSRSVARPRVAAWVARDPRAAAVSRAVVGQGLKIVFLMRLSPAFPYNVLNYALGASGIRFRDYLIGSLGMLPVTFLYTYYGKVIGDVAELAAGAAPPRDGGYYAVLTIGLVATIAVTVIITRAARSALVPQIDP